MNCRMIASQNDGIERPITETTRPNVSSAEFLACGLGHSERDTDDQCEEHSSEGQLQRGWYVVAQILRDRPARRERHPKIARRYPFDIAESDQRVDRRGRIPRESVRRRRGLRAAQRCCVPGHSVQRG